MGKHKRDDPDSSTSEGAAGGLCCTLRNFQKHQGCHAPPHTCADCSAESDSSREHHHAAKKAKKDKKDKKEKKEKHEKVGVGAGGLLPRHCRCQWRGAAAANRAPSCLPPPLPVPALQHKKKHGKDKDRDREQERLLKEAKKFLKQSEPPAPTAFCRVARCTMAAAAINQPAACTHAFASSARRRCCRAQGRRLRGAGAACSAALRRPSAAHLLR